MLKICNAIWWVMEPYLLNIVIHFHQDFLANMHIDFFQGQTDRGLFYEALSPTRWQYQSQV
jgi:hypothetical protein